MDDIILTLRQVEDIFVSITLKALGLPDVPNQDKVRIAYESTGAPDWKHNQDIAFIYINVPNDPISYPKEAAYSPVDTDSMSKALSYTRVIDVKWTLYGPNSFDNSEKIKNSLYLQDIKLVFNKSNLFLIPDIVPPYRIPEAFNGLWWQRSMFSARFNEKVVLYNSVAAIASAEVITQKG